MPRGLAALIRTGGERHEQAERGTAAPFACPIDHSELCYTEGRVDCQQGHSFPIEGGVPVFVELPRREPEPRNMPPCTFDSSSPVDPFVNDWIVNTNGNLYWHLRGRLPRYPIPRWSFARGAGNLFLELGCGWGRWCLSAARAGYTPMGVDIHLEALQAARRLSSQTAPGASFACADLSALPLRDGNLDVVFSYSVLQHIERSEVRRALAEAWRVLKPGGILIVQVPNKFGVVSLLHQARRGFREARPDSFEMRYWSRTQIRELVRTSNFVDARVLADGFFSQNPQTADLDLLPLLPKLIVLFSNFACKLARLVPVLTAAADSLWVTAQKPA